jgi:hypothetical protein
MLLINAIINLSVCTLLRSINYLSLLWRVHMTSLLIFYFVCVRVIRICPIRTQISRTMHNANRDWNPWTSKRSLIERRCSSCMGYIASNGRMTENDELKNKWKWLWTILRYYPCIWFGISSQDSLSSGRNSNPLLPEVPTIQSLRSTKLKPLVASDNWPLPLKVKWRWRLRMAETWIWCAFL